MEAVRDALTQNTVGQISIAGLARLVEAPPIRLYPLIEHGYLKVVIPNDDFDQIIVARPGERRIQWLKYMFQPLVMKPIIPLKEAAELFGLTEGYAEKYCFYFRIPMQSDPAFGNLIPFKSLKRLARAAWSYRRFDRAGLLRYFMSQIERVRWKEPPPYSKRLEKEIGRIATLPQPARTERSIALILAFRDARTATECLRRQKEILGELAKSERQILDLFKRITGLEATWGDGSPEEKSRTEGPVAI
jgi:hypothetical protein